MATEGTWALYEQENGRPELKLVTSDFLDTLERLASRRREDNPTRVHRIEINGKAAQNTAPAEE